MTPDIAAIEERAAELESFMHPAQRRAAEHRLARDIPALLAALKAAQGRCEELESDLRYQEGRADEISDQHDQSMHEVANVLMMLDELAELWGDEGKFRRCRDRLRVILPKETK